MADRLLALDWQNTCRTDSEKSRENWSGDLASFATKRPYQMRMHIYQGRNLPAADDNGQLDPYLIMRFGGKKG